MISEQEQKRAHRQWTCASDRLDSHGRGNDILGLDLLRLVCIIAAK